MGRFFVVGSGGGVSIPPWGGEVAAGHSPSLPSPSIDRQRLRAERQRWQSRGREVEAGGVDATTSQQKRDDRGGGGSAGNCDGNRKCHAAAVKGFGDDIYDNTCQQPLRWGQLAL